MPTSESHKIFPNLPKTLPIFPLEGVLLLPAGRLPLNIFEERYLAMTDDALATNRLIGIIQPKANGFGSIDPKVFQTGCAGKITAFSETEDGRYLITLLGLVRFDVLEEIDPIRGYRRIVPDWRPYEVDCSEPNDIELNRERLTKALKSYFAKKVIDADWDAINRMNNLKLITNLAMICPFDPSEKQALLMAQNTNERAEAIISLLEIASHEGSGADDVRH